MRNFVVVRTDAFVCCVTCLQVCIFSLAVLLSAQSAWGQNSEQEPPPSLLQTNSNQLAVEISYRIDLELDQIDAAQRHLLAARLLYALQTEEVGPSDALTALWSDWQSRLEQLESDRSRIHIPAWFEPSLVDAWDSVIESIYPQQSNMVWAEDIWSKGMASAALKLLTSDADTDRVLAVSLFEPSLAWARNRAPWIWSQLLDELSQEPEWTSIVEPLLQSWLAAPLGGSPEEWLALDDIAAKQLLPLFEVPTEPASALQVSVDWLLSTQWPPYDNAERQLVAFPYLIFLHSEQVLADQLDLSLAYAVQAIDRGQYAELVEVLLAIGMVLMTHPEDVAMDIRSSLAQLDRLDSWVLTQIELVDPRLLTAYQQTRRWLRDYAEEKEMGLPKRFDLLRNLAQIQASVTLDARDLDGYLSQPARERINQELLICFSLSRHRPPLPPQTISPAQYQRCLLDLSSWADSHAATSELTGDPETGFVPEYLGRELGLDPWQRLAYWYGYFEQETDQQCGLEEQVLNPLEWTISARALVWFVQRWPAYADETTQQHIDTLLASGLRILDQQTSLRQCVDNDTLQPVTELLLQSYAQSLEDLIEFIKRQSESFRTDRLQSGSDLDVYAGIEQKTNYRPERLTVVACDDSNSCGMKTELEASRALFGLFPNAFLIADQTQMGQISLCYDQVEWVERRAVKPESRDQAMANYFGKLSFVLKGRYSGFEDSVFEKKLTSQQEYEYLFGENSEEVLNTVCPQELVNKQIVSALPERRFQLVPRRLTYMTAERTHPSVAFEQHWANGDEWRDWFVAGEGVETLKSLGDEEIVEGLKQRLDSLALELNRTVYANLLNRNVANGGSDLGFTMRNIDLHKQSLAAVSSLLYAQTLQQQPQWRASFYGSEGLFDSAMATNLQRQSVQVDQIEQIARKEFQDTEALWQKMSQATLDDLASEADPLIIRTLLKLLALKSQ